MATWNDSVGTLFAGRISSGAYIGLTGARLPLRDRRRLNESPRLTTPINFRRKRMFSKKNTNFHIYITIAFKYEEKKYAMF